MLDYWQLQHNPFAPRAAGEFFLAARCEEALSRLLFVVEQGRRAGAVTGPSQIGKSRLLREVGSVVAGSGCTVVSIDATGLTRAEFVTELANACATRSTRNAWERLQDVLHGWRAGGVKSLWLIDQFDSAADDLTGDVLRLLRLLERAEAAGSVLLAARKLPNSDVFDMSGALEPWNEAECREFVMQRLETAAVGRTVFSSDGLTALAECSRGSPGELIRLCDLALHAGWTIGTNACDAELIRSLAGELTRAPVAPPAGNVPRDAESLLTETETE